MIWFGFPELPYPSCTFPRNALTKDNFDRPALSGSVNTSPKACSSVETIFLLFGQSVPQLFDLPIDFLRLPSLLGKIPSLELWGEEAYIMCARAGNCAPSRVFSSTL